MLHIEKVVKLVTTKLIGMTSALCIAAVFALLPVSTEAQCSTGWDASGMWAISQRGQKEPIHLNLQQNGRVLTGTASITREETPWTGGIFTTNINAVVDGTIDGDNLSVQIFWPDHLTGVYNAKVLPSGRLDGETYDKNNSKIRQTWKSYGALKCLPPRPPTPGPAPAPAQPPPPKPIRATGRRKVTPPPAQPSQPAEPMKVPGIVATRPIFPSPYELMGFTILSWDAGPDHPYAEVWFKVNNGEEVRLVERGKGSQQVPVERGKYYTYTLTDAGNILAVVSFVGQ